MRHPAGRRSIRQSERACCCWRAWNGKEALMDPKRLAIPREAALSAIAEALPLLASRYDLDVEADLELIQQVATPGTLRFADRSAMAWMYLELIAGVLCK